MYLPRYAAERGAIMAFMEAQLTEKQAWVVVDGDCGVEAILGELVDVAGIRGVLDCDWDSLPAVVVEAMQAYLSATLSQYCEHGRWTERFPDISVIEGYGVRSSAPGYTDCTSWVVYATLREARSAYAAERRECKGGD